MSEVNWDNDVYKSFDAAFRASFAEMLFSPHPLMDTVANTPAPPLCVELNARWPKYEKVSGTKFVLSLDETQTDTK